LVAEEDSGEAEEEYAEDKAFYHVPPPISGYCVHATS